MFTKEDIKNDPRFYIDRLFNNQRGQRYTVEDVKIGSILRYWNGHIMSLSDTMVYSFLDGSKEGKSKYKLYCEFCNSPRRTATNYSQLMEDLERNDYDIMKGAIVIDEHNFILDGQHRACILLKNYGPFHRIPVVRCDMGWKLCKRLKFNYLLYLPINWAKLILK